MLETLNPALRVLAFGSAASLVGLNLLAVLRNRSGTTTARLFLGLVLLAVSALVLLELPEVEFLQGLGAVGLVLVSFGLGTAALGAGDKNLRLHSELNVYFLMALLATTACAASTALLSAEGVLTGSTVRLCFFVLLPLLLLAVPLAPTVGRRVASPIEELRRRTLPLTQGNLEGFTTVQSGDEIQDISESIGVMVNAVQKNRVDLEEQLSRLQELEKLRQQFLANVSHELRTPLTMILGNTDILLEDILGKLNEEQKDFLRTVHEQGQVLHQLISDVLAFADIKAGRSELHTREIELRDLIIQVLNRFTPLMRHKQLKVQGKIADIKIVADPDKLKQVMTHLISNAVKFSKKGGSLRVQVTAPADPGKSGPTRFEVVDNGVGIPKNQLARIFDTFYQVDGSSTREHGGTGIGLTIVRHFVEMHGGKIDLQSEVGKGTVARFDLPARALPSPSRSDRGPEKLASLPDNVRVLLASQNPNLIRILKTYLVQGGFDVVSVAELDRVESEVDRLQPGLLLLDVDSEDEALWKILARSGKAEGAAAKAAPVLVVSTRLSQSVLARKGAVDTLELPTDYENFIRAVKTVAASAR